MVLQYIEQGFEWVVMVIERVLFVDLLFWTPDVALPFAVAWLVMWAIVFTVRFQFVNIRGFKHAVDVVSGKFSQGDEESGQITPFQALTAALSATVGLGNIGGVAAAIGKGGPGATFWMIIAGFLGMTSKFSECTLGQKYKIKREDGSAYGGPHVYLKDGLTEDGFPALGRALARIFAVMCVLASCGGGNMFQANQALAQMEVVFPIFEETWVGIVFGIFLAVAVGVVIIGGVKRIADVASTVVPWMCGIYVVFAILFLILNIGGVPGAFGKIFVEAFTPKAAKGGVIGVLVQGFQRAAFSNEAGCGSASIMHSAAKASEPLKEGFVALLEPFIDTIIVCTMTALVIVVSGAYEDKDAGSEIQMTSYAFQSTFPWFGYVLSPIALLFAFSTMISWSYYGEQTVKMLFGDSDTVVYTYKGFFCFCTFLGCNLEAKAVLEFSNLMVLAMAVPNLVGVGMLSGKIKADLDSYWSRLTDGLMEMS